MSSYYSHFKFSSASIEKYVIFSVSGICALLTTFKAAAA
jgi:hypothetical protein